MQGHFRKLAAGAAVFLLATSAEAAIRTYNVAFEVTDLAAPVSFLRGSFNVSFDPATAPFVNDAVPSAALVETAVIGWEPMGTRIDYFPFGTSDPGFLVGSASGSDTNNTINALNANDYRVRFVVDDRFNLLSARGAVKVLNGSTVSFDTARGTGNASWRILIDGKSPAGVIPEPGTWAMLIAGFGIVGASLRRRRMVAA